VLLESLNHYAYATFAKYVLKENYQVRDRKLVEVMHTYVRIPGIRI
jgi:hypothetical protein